MIEEESGTVFDTIPFGGILGLAFPEMAAKGATPFFDNIMKQKVLDVNEFSFYLSLDNRAANAILWGGVDSNFHEGEMEYFPVVERWYWSLELQGMWVGDKQLLGAATVRNPFGPARKPRAIVDTGTTFFTAEAGIYNQIMDLLHQVPCDQMTKETHPDITFRMVNMEGKPRDFVFSYNQYMASYMSYDTEQCVPTFMHLDLPSERGPGMILGEVFI